MEQDRYLHLLLRQLKDIQAQANHIISENSSAEVIESFAKYSKDLQQFMMTKMEQPEIKSYARELPGVNYSKIQYKFWHFLVLPVGLYNFYQDNISRKEIVQEIVTLREKYTHLEMLVKQELQG